MVFGALLVARVDALAQGSSDVLFRPTGIDLVAAQQNAQGNVPAPAAQAENAVEETVRKFRVGVEGGVMVDPELIDFGAHATFGPIFKRGVDFRPGFEIGVGEVTTLFAINLDVTWTLPGATRTTRWTPYIGAGPSFGLSHRGFDTTDDPEADRNNRFDFGDTDFEGGFNFIAGARSRSGVFFEMKATAYGISAVRLLAGYNF
jgi:hypothetical protein